MSRLRSFLRAFRRPALFVEHFPPVAAIVALGALFALAVACGTSGTTDVLVPITGVTVRAETLTAGRGCGTGATQVYKYAVAVFGLDVADINVPPAMQRRDELLASNVYDCFTDGQFVNLPFQAMSNEYAIQVFVYNREAYEAAGGDPIVQGIITRLHFNRTQLDNGGGSDIRAAIQLDLTRLTQTNPTFTTTCDASQLQDVQSLAVCQPFTPGVGGIVKQPAPAAATVTLSAASFPSAEGGVLGCTLDYSRVRYRTSTGSTASGITESACAGLTIQVSPASAPATYAIEVALLRGDESVVGQTVCRADTSPGVTSTAVCAPVE